MHSSILILDELIFTFLMKNQVNNPIAFIIFPLRIWID